jgi:hypothetical protein
MVRMHLEPIIFHVRTRDMYISLELLSKSVDSAPCHYYWKQANGYEKTYTTRVSANPSDTAIRDLSFSQRCW